MDCETNDCQKEKRGCKGCFFENKKESEKMIEENYEHIPHIN